MKGFSAIRATVTGCLVTVTAGALLATATSLPAGAQPVEQFYKGKQIRLIIAARPGGDYDQWARMIGRRIVDYIPGKPTIVPQNMPGGGHLVATNFLYGVAPKDGTVIGTFSRNMPGAALLGRPNANFDPRHFGWLGSPELPSRICVAMASSKVQSAEDLFKSELIVGGTGAGTAPTFLPTVLNQILGTKFRVVDGYTGTSDVVLAMERGEVEGICQTYGAFIGVRGEWLTSGKARILFNTEDAPFPYRNDVPSVFKFAGSDEQKQVLGFITSSVELGRPYVVPPGVPADRLAALRKAFADSLKDPVLIEEAKTQQLTIAYRSGEDLENLIARMYATPKPLLDKAVAMMPAASGE